jgi:hypothetical protein
MGNSRKRKTEKGGKTMQKAGGRPDIILKLNECRKGRQFWRWSFYPGNA